MYYHGVQKGRLDKEKIIRNKAFLPIRISKKRKTIKPWVMVLEEVMERNGHNVC